MKAPILKPKQKAKMNKNEIAKAVWEYKEELEKQEEQERVNFNKCYDEARKKGIEEYGWFKSIFSNKLNWENVSKLAHEIYKRKYGELKDKGDLNG